MKIHEVFLISYPDVGTTFFYHIHENKFGGYTCLSRDDDDGDNYIENNKANFEVLKLKIVVWCMPLDSAE